MALDYKNSLSRYRRYLQLMQTQPLWSASMWLTLSLVLMIVLTWMALRPTLVTISGLFGQINQQTELSKSLDAKILAVRKALQEMESVSSDVILLDKMIPVTPEWESFTQEIYQAATDSGVQVTSIMVDKIHLTTTEASTDKQLSSIVPIGIIPIKFSMSGKGDYRQLVDTLLKIEKSSRMPLIQSSTLSIDKNGQPTITVNGQVGYMPEEKI